MEKQFKLVQKVLSKNIKALRKKTGLSQVSDDERVRLLDVCRPHPDLYLALLLALTTGARQAEIMKLHWDQVNFSKKTISLHVTKNDDSRTLPLVGEASSLLKKRAKDRDISNDCIFPSTEFAVKNKYINLRDPWEKALIDANIPDFRWHDLRHTAASYLTMMGIGHVELARMLGQRTLSMVLRYSHLNSDHVVTTGEKLAARLGVGK